jgi:hypothetical protein
MQTFAKVDTFIIKKLVPIALANKKQTGERVCQSGKIIQTW